MMKLDEIYVAVKEIDYIETRINALCEKYNHYRGVSIGQQKAWLRNYCHDTILLLDDCFETSMLGMRRCKARLAAYQNRDDVGIDNATIDIFNILCELKQLVRTMVPIKDLPSCKKLAELSAEDIVSKAKNLVKSDIVKAGVGALLLGFKMDDVYNTGHLVFPKSKKECKIILSFLNDDIFEGHFTKSIYLSNSKRKP